MNNRLLVIIDIDGRRAEAAAAGLNKSVLGLGGSMQSASSRGASAFDRLTQSMDRAAARARTAVTGVANSFSNLSTRASAAWSAAVNQIGVDTFARNMRQFIQSPTVAAGEAVEALLLNMGPLGVAALGAGIAFAGASVGIYKLVSSVANAAEEIDNISVRTGLSRQEVQQMSLAAETMGVNFGALESAMRPLSQALSDNTDEGKKAKAALESLGVVVEDDFGRFIGLLPFLERFGARLAELPPGVERVNAASKVLGKGASELVPLLVGLGKALNDVRESGAAMSDGLIDSGLKVDGYFDRLMLHLKWLRNAIAAPFVITVDMVGSAIENANAANAAAGGGFGGSLASIGKKAARPAFVGPVEPTAAQRDLLQGNEALEAYTRSLKGVEALERNYAAAREKRETAFGTLQATRGKGAGAFETAKAAYEQALAGERALKAQIEAAKTSHDATKKAAEERVQAEESARRAREQAVLAELEGLDKIDEKYRLLRAELARKVGVDGSPSAFNELQRAQAAETGQLQLDASNRALAGADKAMRDSTAARRKRDEEGFEARAALSAQILDMEKERADSEAAYKITSLGQVRDAQIAALEQYEAKTVEQQVAAVRQRAVIEQQYAEARTLAEIERIDTETRYRVDALRTVLEAQVTAGLIGQDQADVAIDRLNQLGVERTRQAAKDLEASKGSIAAEARNREQGLVRAHNEKLFDDYKRQFEGIFDQLVTRTVSFGSLITSVLLTALKNVLSSQVAGLFTRLVNGGTAGGGGGGFSGGGSGAGSGGGILGRVLGLGGAFGASPSWGGGAPAGGTPPFLPPGAVRPEALAGGGGNGISGLLGAQGAGVKGFLSRLGGLGRGGTDVLGNKLGSIPGTAGANAPGVGGVTGGAMLAGGGLLAMDGLRRGGLMGLAETTAGGALIGAKFGGPMGALIGGAIGAIAGSVRLLFKGAVQKTKEKVREVYGISIDTERATQIAALAKQSFGGNLDMAIRSPQIRDMIQLYSAATGQSTGPQAGVRAATLVQSGGTLYQAPSFEAGRAVGLKSSLPSLQSFVVAPSGGGGGSTTLKLDYQATVDVLSGHAVQAVADHPDVVADSMSMATRSNYGRREQTASQLSPGTLMR